MSGRGPEENTCGEVCKLYLASAEYIQIYANFNCNAGDMSRSAELHSLMKSIQ